MGKTIGKGTYSKVCLISEKGGRKMACKIINKNYAGLEFTHKFLPREIECVNFMQKMYSYINNFYCFSRVVSQILHPNIVNVFKIVEIKNCIYMMMDYCSRGDLLEYIRFNGALTEEQTKRYFK